MLKPDIYRNLGSIAEKLIAQGADEETAYEIAANKCEAADQPDDEESLQWD